MPNTLNVGAPSLFVTATAWVTILLASLVSVLAGVQLAQLASMLPQWQPGAMPGVSGWLLRDLPWVLGAAAVLSLLLSAAAAGLLLRLEAARRIFIGLVAAVIGVHLCGLWLQHELMQALVQHTLGRSGLPEAAAGLFGGLATATQVLGVLLTLAACALLGWVIARLRSDAVRQEFA